MVAEKARAEEARQAELSRLAEEHGKAAEALADAGKKIAQLKKDLEAQARASTLRENGMLGEAQHLDETFARKCYFFFGLAGVAGKSLSLTDCFLPLPGVFPETQEAADAAVYTHRADLRTTGAEIDVYTAWSLSEIVLACEFHL